MNENPATNVSIRKLAGAIGFLTAFVLACVVGILMVDLLSLLGGDAPASDSGIAQVSHDSRTQGEAAQPREGAGFHEFLFKTILTVAIVLALAVVAPLLCASYLFILIRRHSQQFGPLIRVEYPAAAPVVVGPYAASSLGVVVPAVNEAGNRLGTESTAHPLVLGPTFEEERLSQENLVQRQQAGVLQHLFEENLRLHETIEHVKESEQDSRATPADGTGPETVAIATLNETERAQQANEKKSQEPAADSVAEPEQESVPELDLNGWSVPAGAA